MTGTSKLVSEDDVVGRLRSGMTIGIGGWGSRRKPMSLVRALLRSDLNDLHVVTYGGPDVGMLCAAGKVSRLTFAFVSLDSIPLEPHFRKARESGSIACTELDEGMVLLGLQAAAWRVPFLPTRVGLGSDLFRVEPRPAHGALALPVARRGGRRGAGRRAGHPPRRRARATSTSATSAATPPSSDRTSTSTTSCSRRPSSRFVSVERIVPTEDLVARGR